MVTETREGSWCSQCQRWRTRVIHGGVGLDLFGRRQMSLVFSSGREGIGCSGFSCEDKVVYSESGSNLFGRRRMVAMVFGVLRW